MEAGREDASTASSWNHLKEPSSFLTRTGNRDGLRSRRLGDGISFPSPRVRRFGKGHRVLARRTPEHHAPPRSPRERAAPRPAAAGLHPAPAPGFSQEGTHCPLVVAPAQPQREFSSRVKWGWDRGPAVPLILRTPISFPALPTTQVFSMNSPRPLLPQGLRVPHLCPSHPRVIVTASRPASLWSVWTTARDSTPRPWLCFNILFFFQ